MTVSGSMVMMVRRSMGVGVKMSAKMRVMIRIGMGMIVLIRMGAQICLCFSIMGIRWLRLALWSRSMSMRSDWC